ncbi:MAG: DUF3106 domain-containing protein [Rhodoferax sp.]|nr:DUF3106 domain-containing protein [Rhodoferax sp.]
MVMFEQNRYHPTHIGVSRGPMMRTLCTFLILTTVTSILPGISPIWAAQTSYSSLTLGKSNAERSQPAPPKPRSIESGPRWHTLTVDQMNSLKPLADKWSDLRETQKRKWIAIAASFKNMSPADQIKLHSRMTEWVNLSAPERAQARLNFSAVQSIARDDKLKTWQAYQALSPEERKRLAATEPAPLPKSGARSSVITEKKLAVFPANRLGPGTKGRLMAHADWVDRNTLLPTVPGAIVAEEVGGN